MFLLSCRLGLALLILVVLQSLLGVFSHKTKSAATATTSGSSSPSTFIPPSSSLTPMSPLWLRPTITRHSSPFRLAHIVVGLLTALLGMYQVKTGIHKWRQSTLPSGVKAGFWVIVAVEGAAYLGGWAWELTAVARREKAGEREGAMREKRGAERLGSVPVEDQA